MPTTRNLAHCIAGARNLSRLIAKRARARLLRLCYYEVTQLTSNK